MLFTQKQSENRMRAYVMSSTFARFSRGSDLSGIIFISDNLGRLG